MRKYLVEKSVDDLARVKSKKNLQKSLFILFMIIVFSGSFITAAQASSYRQLMKIGLINPNLSDQYVVIYSDDQSECLSTAGDNRRGKKVLSYAPCRKDGTDTWVITKTGKIKNKGNGKCLGAPKAQDSLLLMHCYFRYSKDNSLNDFIILDHLTDTDTKNAQIADLYNK